MLDQGRSASDPSQEVSRAPSALDGVGLDRGRFELQPGGQPFASPLARKDAFQLSPKLVGHSTSAARRFRREPRWRQGVDEAQEVLRKREISQRANTRIALFQRSAGVGVDFNSRVNHTPAENDLHPGRLLEDTLSRGSMLLSAIPLPWRQLAKQCLDRVAQAILSVRNERANETANLALGVGMKTIDLNWIRFAHSPSFRKRSSSLRNPSSTCRYFCLPR